MSNLFHLIILGRLENLDHDGQFHCVLAFRSKELAHTSLRAFGIVICTRARARASELSLFIGGCARLRELRNRVRATVVCQRSRPFALAGPCPDDGNPADSGSDRIFSAVRFRRKERISFLSFESFVFAAEAVIFLRRVFFLLSATSDGMRSTADVVSRFDAKQKRVVFLAESLSAPSVCLFVSCTARLSFPMVEHGQHSYRHECHGFIDQ